MNTSVLKFNQLVQETAVHSGENDDDHMSRVYMLYATVGVSLSTECWLFLKGKHKWTNPDSTLQRRSRLLGTDEEPEHFGEDDFAIDLRRLRSAMIDVYNKNGHFKEALEIFRYMQREKVKVKKFVLSSDAKLCNVGSLEQGKWIHDYARRNVIELDGVLGTALLDMYAKLGRLDLAWDVFETMKTKEVSSWNAMIGVVSKHRNTKCFVLMEGRAGRLAEAEELISIMPMTPSPAVWGALLSACRVHGDMDMGERIRKDIERINPKMVVDMP
ncbi:pentatricopeptide repeat-containing protein [Tanacetum coccineum]